jgi:hypothetical protein
MFAHIFKTWALAQVLHPIIFLIYVVLVRPSDAEFWLAWIFFILIFSVLASIPSFLTAWLLFYIISNTEFTQGEKLIAWFVSVMAAILVNFILLSIAVDGTIDGEMHRMILPSLIAAVLSVLIRVRSFFQFQSNYKMTTEKIIKS